MVAVSKGIKGARGAAGKRPKDDQNGGTKATRRSKFNFCADEDVLDDELSKLLADEDDDDDESPLVAAAPVSQ